MTGWGVWPMADFYNTYYSVPEKLTRELYSVSCMSLRRRSIVAGSLADAWSEFEAAFEDAQGFKEVSADARTRFRLDLLSLAERFNPGGATVGGTRRTAADPLSAVDQPGKTRPGTVPHTADAQPHDGRTPPSCPAGRDRAVRGGTPDRRRHQTLAFRLVPPSDCREIPHFCGPVKVKRRLPFCLILAGGILWPSEMIECGGSMADLYNDIYTTADEFHREMDRVMALTREDKISVAAGLTKVWSEFEKIFEDETGFKQATAFERTRHRLALLKRTGKPGRAWSGSGSARRETAGAISAWPGSYPFRS